MAQARAKVAVMISGSGTNMAALLYASRAENCPYEIVLVAANDPEAKGLRLAEAEGVATFAIEAGDSHGGVTVHLGTAELDDGPILGQTPVAILPGDKPEDLAARVLIAEHQLYSRCLARLVTRETSAEWLLEQVRERAMAMPEADEIVSHGMPCFGIVKGKKFAYFTSDHHGDGRIALLVKISGVDEQTMLIEQDEERYFRPAYFGDGWIGIRLDLGDNDWDSLGDWIMRSWRNVAPRKLTALLDAM